MPKKRYKQTIEKALNCTFLRIKDNQFDFNHIEIPQVILQKNPFRQESTEK